MLRFRLSECEEGFKLIRGDTNAYTRDTCEVCEFGKLALGQAVYAPLHESRLDQCIECQDLTGVLCKGGMQIAPSPGFWIDPTQVLEDFSESSMFDPKVDTRRASTAHTDRRNRNRTTIEPGDHVFAFYPDLEDNGNKSVEAKLGMIVEWHGWDGSALIKFNGEGEAIQVRAEWVEQRSIKAYQCANDACLSDFTCREGHYGRICGLCNGSYVMSSDGCTLCDEDQEGSYIATVFFTFTSLLLWYFVWRPWFRFFERFELWVALRLVDMLVHIATFVGNLVNRFNKRANRAKQIKRILASFFRIQNIIGYGKVVIGFYQVTATFLLNFSVEWPDLMGTVLGYMNFLSFDFFSLPTVSCLFKDYSYMAKHQIFTMAPLFVILLLMMPSVLACSLSKLKIVVVEASVIKELVSAFFFAMLSFLFLIYPAVSSTVLNTFNCIDLDVHGNWLKVDMRVQCPRDTLDVGFTWSLVFVFIYPVGIPIIFGIILWYFSVPNLAQRKQDLYRFKALIARVDESILPNVRSIAAHLDKWTWKHDPVCLLTREECLLILRHSWTPWEEFETGGIESRMFGGKAFYLVNEAAQNVADAVANAADQVQDSARPSQDSNSNDNNAATDGTETALGEQDSRAASVASDSHARTPAGMQASALCRNTQDQDMPLTTVTSDTANAGVDPMEVHLVSGASFGSAPPMAGPSTPRPQSDEEEIAPAPTLPEADAAGASKSLRDASPVEEANEEEDEYAEMDEFDVRLSTSELVASLCKESILVVPPIVWNGECGAEEELAIDRAGFLFSMYQVSPGTRSRSFARVLCTFRISCSVKKIAYKLKLWIVFSVHIYNVSKKALVACS